jgi:hypothetical protein
MNEDSTIRRANLLALRMTPRDLSERCGRRYTYWRDLLQDSTKSFGEKVARSIEGDLGLPRGWLDTPHDHSETAAAATFAAAEAPAPYLATAQDPSLTAALMLLERQLAGVAPDAREAVATNLAGWARNGGGQHWMRSLVALLEAPPEKPLRTGTQ